MFTGIVQGKVKVSGTSGKPGLLTITLEISPELISKVELGASISINGVCLTVAEVSKNSLSFDVMQQTLDCTTLGTLKVNDLVNIERSLKFGDEIGGHLLSGHIDTRAKITNIETPENNFVITFSIEPQWMRYVFEKGYIAINGASLTLAKVNKDKNEFTVFLIPETLRLTTFSESKVGDKANIEIDRQTQIIVETVERVLAEKK